MAGWAVQVTGNGTGDPMTFGVTVREGGGETRHQVTLKRATYDRLAGGVQPQRFVEAAFGFLLEREPKEAILGRFDVDVISRYFPEFPRAIGDYL
ncbi:MAG: hypothetical protein HQL52_07725 [Magnetococcales bacterium]|nr:hypothetical protein [Magnetococcales bacterium]